MKLLFIFTALIEGATGLTLLYNPSAVVFLLLGSPLETLAAIALGRVAGSALCALAVANWISHSDIRSASARGLVCAMSLYNLGTVGVLGAAGMGKSQTGVALWPALIFHAVMAIWCIASLLKKSVAKSE